MKVRVGISALLFSVRCSLVPEPGHQDGLKVKDRCRIRVLARSHQGLHRRCSWPRGSADAQGRRPAPSTPTDASEPAATARTPAPSPAGRPPSPRQCRQPAASACAAARRAGLTCRAATPGTPAVTIRIVTRVRSKASTPSHRRLHAKLDGRPHGTAQACAHVC